MIMKQTREYKEPDTETTETPTAEEESTEKPKKRKPVNKTMMIFAIIGIVVVVFGIFVYASFVQKRTENPPSDTDPSSDIGDTGTWEGGDDGDDAAYWEQFDNISYTEDEKASLRAWGYTGTEIEAFEAEQRSVEELIAESRQKQEETMAALSDVTSPEYQNLLNKTWLGQKELDLPAYTEDIEYSLTYTTLVLNADYEKIPAHGHSLFLKVYMEDGSYAFMECPLIRYLQLPDKGNIVVQYDVINIDGADIITGMKEVPVE